MSLPRQIDLFAGEYEVRESARSRRLVVRVHDTALVEVVVPRGTPPRAIEKFLGQHLDWIGKRVARARAQARPPEAFPPHTIELAALGESWRLHARGGPGRLRLQEQPGHLLELAGSGGEVAVARALVRWLARHAEGPLAAALDGLGAQHGFRYSKLQLRLQRTRWGSCSTRGTISLNVALLFQQPAVLRYLMIHELVHTRHMNHSRNFWSEVAACEPDYRRLDALLRKGWSNTPTWLRDLRRRN